MTGNVVTFEQLGASIWEAVRRHDSVAIEILRYYSRRNTDKAECVMRDAVSAKFDVDNADDFVRGAYHCLCGLELLEPYIDKEGVECARITPSGRDVLGL